MTKDKVITRFPPSPTGALHIGGARTALFNWLFARQNQGKFILRIEDTDQERSTEEAARAIVDSMEWLGMDWDEGPYYQSERTEIYNAHIDRMLAKDGAYYCCCTREEVERKRQEALAKGLKPKYDGTCREKGLGPQPGAVVRLKSPQEGTTQFHDLIKGTIRFNNEELDDLILRRSNGSPTYHMAVVADDLDLGVTHVIRGDDHVNNTPRQILIYQALDEPLPKYAHLPMILGPDKQRLSKRHGAVSLLAYRDMGYLPQALLNALARLGWSYGDQEKFSKEELIEKFSLDHVGKAAGVFNQEKLLDLNAWYIRQASDEDIARAVRPFLTRIGIGNPPEQKLRAAVRTVKPRSTTLVDLADRACFYFKSDIAYDEKGDRKFLVPEVLEPIEDLCKRLEGAPEFHEKALEKVFTEFLEERDIKLKKVAQPLRVALTGKTASPGLFEVLEVLGKENSIARLRKALDHIRKK